MSVGVDTLRQTVRPRRRRLVRSDLPWRRRLAYITAVYLAVFGLCFLLAELGFRLFWSPKYWVHTNQWLVGSGQTEAGKKWWPDTSYVVESSEFRTEFRTNTKGYRAGPGPTPAQHAYRVAFVGDSFTEGMQVSYESTFCAPGEVADAGGWVRRSCAKTSACRRPTCSSIGTGFITTCWQSTHRTRLFCAFIPETTSGTLPDDAFDGSDKPLADYYRRAGWAQHVIAWVNLHSKFGSYAQRALLSVAARLPSSSQAPKNWWADPASAAQSADVPAVRRSRSILCEIEQECRKKGTELCVLVVGPIANYAALNGESPLSRIMVAWGLDVPVIDIAIKARALPDRRALTFPIDGHLTESGHEYLADGFGAMQVVDDGNGERADSGAGPDYGRLSVRVELDELAAGCRGRLWAPTMSRQYHQRMTLPNSLPTIRWLVTSQSVTGAEEKDRASWSSSVLGATSPPSNGSGLAPTVSRIAPTPAPRRTGARSSPGPGKNRPGVHGWLVDLRVCCKPRPQPL